MSTTPPCRPAFLEVPPPDMFPSPTARNLTVVLPIPRDPASWRRVHQKAYLPEGQSPAPRRTGRAREATPPQGPRPRPRPFPDHVGPCGGPRLLEVPGARDLGATPPRERSEWDPGPLLRSAVWGPQTPCRQSSLFSLGPRAQLSRALLLRQVGSQSAPPGSEQCEGRGSPLPPPAPCQGWARWKGAGLGVWRETGRGAFSWVPNLGVSLLRTDSAPETAVGLTPAPRDLVGPWVCWRVTCGCDRGESSLLPENGGLAWVEGTVTFLLFDFFFFFLEGTPQPPPFLWLFSAP